MKTLKNKVEFDFVYKNSKRYDGGCFHSYILTLSHPVLRERRFSFKERAVYSHLLAHSQDFFAGFSVSKKMGNAPTRNKIKRWFRAFCRNYSELLAGKAVIFVARDFQKMSYSLIEIEMLKVLQKR